MQHTEKTDINAYVPPALGELDVEWQEELVTNLQGIQYGTGTGDHLSTSLTLYWQYLHPAESFGLSRYPPAAFTKSLAQAAHVWPDGGLNTANSSGLHVIFRPLRDNCEPNH
jgi:hypothetical protein